LVGVVERADVWDALAAADVCLHCLRPDPLFTGALPTKMLEYMSARRPVLTTVAGLPAELAVAAGGGFAPTADALAAHALRWRDLAPAERRARGDLSFEVGQQLFGLEATVDRLEALLLETADARR